MSERKAIVTKASLLTELNRAKYVMKKADTDVSFALSIIPAGSETSLMEQVDLVEEYRRVSKDLSIVLERISDWAAREWQDLEGA